MNLTWTQGMDLRHGPPASSGISKRSKGAKQSNDEITLPLMEKNAENCVCILRNLSYHVHKEVPGAERFQEPHLHYLLSRPPGGGGGGGGGGQQPPQQQQQQQQSQKKKSQQEAAECLGVNRAK
ncbi:hypothetical protein CRUP_016411, partial [Coryphaenoides rupestris]